MSDNPDLIEDDNFSFSSSSTKNIKNKKMFLTRRCSVFSKSYDPENTDFEPESYTDSETLTNKIYENNKLCSLNRSDKFENLKKILKSIILFKHLDDDDIDNVIGFMFERPCTKNEMIVKQNEPGNYLYIISSGVFDVYVKENTCSNDTGKRVAEFNNDGFFGELALLYDQSRSATVICRQDGLLFCMNRDTFQKFVISISYNRRRKYINLLESIPFLKDSMTHCERSKVVDALTTVNIESNTCIFRQQDTADGMYFIELGVVRIEKDGQVVNMLKSGDYFGELALLNKSPRSATAFAIEKCKLAFLEIEAFERLMGPCIELLKNELDYIKKE